jgi:hypothetical protein
MNIPRGHSRQRVKNDGIETPTIPLGQFSSIYPDLMAVPGLKNGPVVRIVGREPKSGGVWHDVVHDARPDSLVVPAYLYVCPDETTPLKMFL